MIDDGTRAGALRDVNGTFAGQVVALAIDAVRSGAPLQSTGLTAGDAFSELGELILDGLNRPAGPQARPRTAAPRRATRATS